MSQLRLCNGFGKVPCDCRGDICVCDPNSINCGGCAACDDFNATHCPSCGSYEPENAICSECGQILLDDDE